MTPTTMMAIGSGFGPGLLSWNAALAGVAPALLALFSVVTLGVLLGRTRRQAAQGERVRVQVARPVWTATVLALVLGSASVGVAAEAGVKRVSATDAPVARIAIDECHLESTPPFEQGRRVECRRGEVIVAVYEDAVRCCSLSIR